jgi:cysteine-rich repeat protein
VPPDLRRWYESAFVIDCLVLTHQASLFLAKYATPASVDAKTAKKKKVMSIFFVFCLICLGVDDFLWIHLLGFSCNNNDCTPVCGDGFIVFGYEECEPKRTLDGCTPLCRAKPGYDRG